MAADCLRKSSLLSGQGGIHAPPKLRDGERDDDARAYGSETKQLPASDACHGTGAERPDDLKRARDRFCDGSAGMYTSTIRSSGSQPAFEQDGHRAWACE